MSQQGQLNGATTPIGTPVTKLAMQTGTTPVVATAAGVITLSGAVVAAGTNPIRSDGTGANTATIEVQKSQALAATDATKIGLSNFDSASFAVDANGFVTASSTGIIKTITGNTGGAEAPSGGNFNVVGTGSITVAGSANTETVQLTGLTNHNVLVGAGTATVTNVAPSATSGVPLVSAGAAADPAFGTAAIEGGGTNATSFTQTQGIVVYNGTSLVNYAGPQLSTSGVYTNTSQPFFNASIHTEATNSWGNNTQNVVVFATENTDQASNYNPATGVFTAPVTGNYNFNSVVALNNTGGLTSAANAFFNVNGALWTFDGQAFVASDPNGFITLAGSLSIHLTAGQTVDVEIFGNTAAATKTGSFYGSAGTQFSWFSGYLVC